MQAVSFKSATTDEVQTVEEIQVRQARTCKATLKLLFGLGILALALIDSGLGTNVSAPSLAQSKGHTVRQH
jgi:hypothetical protein